MPPNSPRCTACALSVLLLAGCGSPGPPHADDQPDSTTTPPAASQDVYFEGSQRVWEAARDRGVIFRAVGQEPGWVLEVEDSRITLVTNYGADEVVTPVPEPVVDAASRTTAWHVVTETNDLRIEARAQSCADTMSEERFSMTVTVTLNGTTHHGCGRMLDRLP
jgi:uncharacterized membrane protein